MKHFIEANQLEQNNGTNWQVYFPCGYNNAEAEFNKIESISPDQKIFIIKGCDNISRKDTLWAMLRAMYGQKATRLMPMTYVLTDPKEVQRLEHEFDSRKVYILKKNIQRQEGLKISRDKEELRSGLSKGYVVAQEMLQDPYIIDGRKTNCRVYLLIVCSNGEKRSYLYTNGFVYYTPKTFIANSTDPDRVITAGLATGRRDSKFYETHPLTVQDLQKYVGSSVDLVGRVATLMSAVMKASSPYICTQSKLDDRTTFQLFGCDIAFNANLEPQLMEINKGPDLSSKTQREADVKDVLMELIFQTVKVIPNRPVHGGRLVRLEM